jgi:hypothetical protein
VQYQTLVGEARKVLIDHVIHGNEPPLSRHLVLCSQVSIVHINPLHMDVLWYQALLQLLLLVVVMYFVLCLYCLFTLL